MSEYRTFTEQANAKINLYLDVTSSREDGFHDIVSIMQSIDLSDRLLISARISDEDTKIELTCNWPHIPTDRRNLVWRAAESFCREAGLCLDLKIHLEKHIPSEAGLAGGSTDAAAILRVLHREYARSLPIERLETVAASLGSDIPFCLRGGSVICTGRGEVMKELPSLPQLHLLVMHSGESVSTGEAYRRIDMLLPNIAFHPSAEQVASAFVSTDGKQLGKLMYNLFEEAILPTCPVAASMKASLLASGAYAAMMSGSGSAVYGLFENKEKALSAAKQLSKNARYAQTTAPIKL